MRAVTLMLSLLLSSCRESPPPRVHTPVHAPADVVASAVDTAPPSDAAPAPADALAAADTSPAVDAAPASPDADAAASPDTLADDAAAPDTTATPDATLPPVVAAADAPPEVLRDLARWCRGREDADECRIPMNATLGFSRDGGSLTLLVTPSEPSCMTQTADAIAVVSMPGLAETRRVDIAWSEDADLEYERAMKRGWHAIRVASKDLVPARNLIATRDEAEGGIRMYWPRATLGSPYDGWRVLASARTGVIKVRPRGAKDPIEIGTLAGGTYPSVDEVVLSPNERWLVLTISWHDGDHCGSTRVKRAAFPWPPRAVAPAAPDAGP